MIIAALILTVIAIAGSLASPWIFKNPFHAFLFVIAMQILGTAAGVILAVTLS